MRYYCLLINDHEFSGNAFTVGDHNLGNYINVYPLREYITSPKLVTEISARTPQSSIFMRVKTMLNLHGILALLYNYIYYFLFLYDALTFFSFYDLSKSKVGI